MTAPSPLDLGAARVAAALLWSAVVRSPAAYDPPRFVWNDDMQPVDADAAAEHLARLPKPLLIRAAPHEGVVRLETGPSERAARRSHYSHWLSEITRDGGDDRVLLLSGGRALRVGLEILERLDDDYRLDVPTGGSGGPLDDPWTLQLGLPPSWLEGVSMVFLLGYHDGGSMGAPIRRRGQWSEEQIEDLTKR